MEVEAATLGAQMVTTEKDAVRLPRHWRHRVITLPVRLQLDDREGLVEDLARLVQPRWQVAPDGEAGGTRNDPDPEVPR